MSYSGLSLYQRDAKAAASAYGVPWPIFAGMISQESGWDQNQIGSVGEIGLGQLKASTAADLGVNPYSASDNLIGAAKYLRQQFDRFGNWSDALGAYNQGAAGYQGGGAAKGKAYASSVLAKSAQFGDASVGGAGEDGGNYSLSFGPDAAPSEASGASQGGNGIAGAIQSSLGPVGSFFTTAGSVFTSEFWVSAWSWVKDHLIILAVLILALFLIVSGTGRMVTSEGAAA